MIGYVSSLLSIWNEGSELPIPAQHRRNALLCSEYWPVRIEKLGVNRRVRVVSPANAIAEQPTHDKDGICAV